MSEILIRPFAIADIDGVFSVILPIQRDEFGIAITSDDQPDLAVIPDFYQARKGQFWVAETRRNDRRDARPQGYRQ